MTAEKSLQPLLSVQDLQKWFPVKGGFFKTVGQVKAVDGISFAVNEGETFGLVGESGCGKSTTGRLILGLLRPTGGIVELEGQKIAGLSAKKLWKLRRDMQMIFQDPYASLNPRLSVEQVIMEPMQIHHLYKKNRRERVVELLETVGLSEHHRKRYPHEFSGGQRQRICIARALALNPRFIVCDEPVSALDVSVQSQIINLLVRLQQEFNLTYLFISHDLSVINHICDRVGVMYLGKIVETASNKGLFNSPIHPYTRALLSAVPIPDPSRVGQKIILEGDIPSPSNPPSGCAFHTRCWLAEEKCKEVSPQLEELTTDHYIACHFKEQLAEQLA